MSAIPLPLLLLLLLATLPYYYFARWLERTLKPRETVLRFFSWFLLVLLSAVLYFWLAGNLYIHILQPKFFHN